MAVNELKSLSRYWNLFDFKGFGFGYGAQTNYFKVPVLKNIKLWFDNRFKYKNNIFKYTCCVLHKK